MNERVRAGRSSYTKSTSFEGYTHGKVHLFLSAFSLWVGKETSILHTLLARSSQEPEAKLPGNVFSETMSQYNSFYLKLSVRLLSQSFIKIMSTEENTISTQPVDEIGK